MGNRCALHLCCYAKNAHSNVYACCQGRVNVAASMAPHSRAAHGQNMHWQHTTSNLCFWALKTC
eukprot:2483282-Rhodomonas_salina.4